MAFLTDCQRVAPPTTISGLSNPCSTHISFHASTQSRASTSTMRAPGIASRTRSTEVMSSGRPPKSQYCLGREAPKREPVPAPTIITVIFSVFIGFQLQMTAARARHHIPQA